MLSDAPGDDLAQARALLHQGFRALAEQSGRWQQEQQMAWWLSGLPAMGANLMLDCGPAPDPQRLEALARRLRGLEVPAGWLIWPDQCPALQQSVVRASGFQACERLWLARLAAGELSAAPEPSLAPPLSIRRLIPRDAPALTELYRVAHQIPPCFAGVSARAFVSQLPTVLSTYGGFVPVDGSPQLKLVAAITVVLESPPRGHQEAERAGLVWLGTHPQLRRRGIGSQLTGEVARLLVGSGVTCIHVQASPAAVGLYQALGFRCNGWLELWGHEPLREQ